MPKSDPDPSPSNDIARRASLIDKFQRGFTTARQERSLAALFLDTGGTALTALKNAIDAGEDYHDLHQLLYHDIDDAAVRDELLHHFRNHAQPTGQLKILSDIDDTFYVNWLDARYPKQTVYPGVRALYHELDLGPRDGGELGDLVFLTARPYDRFGAIDKLTHDMLHQHGVPRSAVLAGDLAHLLSNQLIAEEKHKRFLEFAPLYPEYDYVFLGDSGQGDAIAGEMMLAHPSVRAVFIHDISGMPEIERAENRARRIFLHDTYLGAALYAFSLGLISRPGLSRVALAAVAELVDIEFTSTEQQESMLAHFRRDLAALNDLLPDSERIDPRVLPPPAKPSSVSLS
jgi:hypothetical protein